MGAQVNGAAAMMREIDIKDAVFSRAGADRDVVPMECAGNFEFAVSKAQFAIPFHPYDLIIRAILDRRQDLREGAWAGTIAGDWRLHLQSLMGPLMVIDLAPALEGRLGMRQMLETFAIEDFSLQRAMETLLLAVGLRVIGTAMAEADSQTDQPQSQFSHLPGVAWRTPRRPVIEVHPNRQAVAAEGGFQMFAHGLRPRVAAGLQNEVVAGMVVEYGQRRAASLQGLEMSLEIRLPQDVGLFVLEALPGLVLRCPGDNQSVAMQDAADRTGRHTAQPEIMQAPTDLAPTPGRVLKPHIDHSPIK